MILFSVTALLVGEKLPPEAELDVSPPINVLIYISLNVFGPVFQLLFNYIIIKLKIIYSHRMTPSN